jgi:hypothetical protein
MVTAACWCATNARTDEVPHPHNTQAGCPVLIVPPPAWANPAPRIEFDGGGHREGNGDRPRFDLLWSRSQPLERQILHRDAVWAAYGAKKYGERNWEQFNTQEALQRCLASLGRHYAAFMVGDTSEDHAAAIRENVRYIEYIRERLAAADAAGEGTY